MSRYVIRIGKELLTYENYNDIPTEFDHVIEFAPDYPDDPHTPEQHQEMSKYNRMLHDLLAREKKR